MGAGYDGLGKRSACVQKSAVNSNRDSSDGSPTNKESREEQAEKPSVELSETDRPGSADSPRSASPSRRCIRRQRRAMRTEDEAAGRDCPANGSETEVSRIVTNSTRGDKRARFAGTRRAGARGGWRGEETAPEDILAYVKRGTARCRDATTRSEPAAANRAHVGKNTLGASRLRSKSSTFWSKESQTGSQGQPDLIKGGVTFDQRNTAARPHARPDLTTRGFS